MTEAKTLLFVYGTLMPTESNYHQIEDHVRAARPGTIEGVLVDLGAYPALIPGHGIVRGVVLELDVATLDITDRIEGYSRDRDRCLYVREEVVVQFEDGREVVAWTYLFANSVGVADCPRLIVSESDGVTVFAWCLK